LLRSRTQTPLAPNGSIERVNYYKTTSDAAEQWYSLIKDTPAVDQTFLSAIINDHQNLISEEENHITLPTTSTEQVITARQQIAKSLSRQRVYFEKTTDTLTPSDQTIKDNLISANTTNQRALAILP